MKKLSLVVIGIVLLCLQSCIPSLHPFFFAKDLIKDDRLVGTWSGDEGEGLNDVKSSWTFKDTNHEHYHLTFTEEGVSASFDASLFKLDNQLYLDLYPQSGNNNMNTLLAMSSFPGHLLCKVIIQSEGLTLQILDSDHLEKLFENHQIRLRHIKNNEGQIMLTANTKELRAFIIKYGKDDSFFTESDIMTRKVISE